MPTPSSALTTLRSDLSDSLMEFDLEANLGGFAGYQVFPIINVPKQAGQFGKIPIEQLLQERDTKRAPGSGYSRGKFKFETATYSCEEHGAEDPVDEREKLMYSEFLDADIFAALRARSTVMVNAETRIADAVFNTTTWTGAALTTAITDEWDDLTAAVPITDVENAVRKVYDGSGLWPNALVINRKVFRNLRNCTQIINRITASGAGSPAKPTDVTTQMLAAVFDLPYIIVAGGTKNSANEGAAVSPGQIWSDEYAMVCKIATSNDFREPCIGRTFHWTEDGSNPNGTVEEYEEPQTRSKIIRVRHDVDEIVLYAQAGHLLSNITT